jgi:hypothetical protein
MRLSTFSALRRDLEHFLFLWPWGGGTWTSAPFLPHPPTILQQCDINIIHHTDQNLSKNNYKKKVGPEYQTCQSDKVIMDSWPTAEGVGGG